MVDEPGTTAVASMPPHEVPARPASTAVSATAVADPWASFDRWSSRVLLLFAALSLVVLLVMVGGLGSAGLGPLVGGCIVVPTAAFAGLLYATAAGLSRALPWARAAATWLLAILIAAGLLDLAMGLAAGRLSIPLGSILAALALSRRPGPLPATDAASTRLARRIGVAGLLLALVPPLATFAALDARSPLAVGPDAMIGGLAVTCEGDGMPWRIRATADWEWLRRDVLGSPPGTVAIAWSLRGVEAGEALVIQDTTSSGDAVASGGAGPAAGAVDLALAGWTSWSWTVEPVDGTLPDGSVTVVLAPAGADPAERPEHGVLDLRSVYANGNRWTQEHAVSCEW
jgi:hypothetical protein